MSDSIDKKPLFRLSDLWSLPVVYIAVVAVEYLWNWIFEGEGYIEWGYSLRMTIFIFIFVKAGEALRRRKQ